MSLDVRSRLKQMLATGELRLEPPAYPQQEIWQASRVPPGAVANHICAILKVRGVVTAPQAESAVRRVVERQEALRTSILPGKEGRPVQMIRAQGDVPFSHRLVPAAMAHPEGIEELAREIFLRPFDLTSGPLFRLEMLEIARDEIVIALAIHHSIADGWTLGVFVQDLCSAYLMDVRGMRGPLPPVPMTYAQWGAADRAAWPAADLDSRAEYWLRQLKAAPRLWPATKITDQPLSRWITHIPADLSSAIRQQARQLSATLYSTLLADFQLAVARWTGKNDFVIGTPVANRNKAAVKETMGYFSGVVPVRAQVDFAETSQQRVIAVNRQVMDGFANAMPFAELAARIETAADTGHHPIFDVRFALQNHPVPEISLSTLSAKLHMRSTGTARFDLGCEITEEGESLEVVWLHRPELFSHKELEELNRIYQESLAETCRALCP